MSSGVRAGALVAMALVAAALPLVGLVSLLLRSQLDPHIENYPLHFVVFGVVGAVAFGLGYAAGEAANRRGDARVLLLSLAFMATGGFLWLHALGTPTILFSKEHAGFQVAIPVGLLVGAVFAAGSAFVDHPSRDRRGAHAPADAPASSPCCVSMGVWFVWTVASLPPLGGSDSEAATNRFLTVIAVLGSGRLRGSAPRGTGASSATIAACSPRPSSPASRCCPRRRSALRSPVSAGGTPAGGSGTA